ncbi:hypothetical protein [Flavobacterium sp. 7A]|uniref:hypothetical protein n=1 Tax=Flavobacterium sp. 7A TaxID=2940571 RepID=UPI002226B117|nr:hypothetical protein [Flavobacterium sp. 7A]MCW2119241.1 hypothetical protein [Flavobacterium sp. 7A]
METIRRESNKQNLRIIGFVFLDELKIVQEDVEFDKNKIVTVFGFVKYKDSL